VKLGWIADYLSRALLVGFVTGVAVVLIIGQVGKLFGLSAIVILLLIRRFAPSAHPTRGMSARAVTSAVTNIDASGVGREHVYPTVHAAIAACAPPTTGPGFHPSAGEDDSPTPGV
jgi:Sulfate permease family